MGGEVASMQDVGLLELGDGVLGLVDVRQDVQLVVAAFKRVVRSMPGVLQDDERFSEVLDFRLEAFHHLFVPAGTFRFSVFEGAVHPVPRGAATRPS